MPHAATTCVEPRPHPTVVPLGGHVGRIPGTVRIERRTLVLEICSAGRLVPWIGPAIRGITALRYRAAVCLQPRQEWSGRWKHCRGCPHIASCGYGVSFEPDAPAPRPPSENSAATGNCPAGPPPTIDAPRPIVIAPDYPVAVNAQRGMHLPVRITAVGSDAAESIPGIIDALADAGRSDGLGPDRVRFSLTDPSPRADVIVVDPARLPSLSSTGPTIPRLTIRLDSPLFLREREARDRKMVVDPGFATFVRHSVRIVREFFPSVDSDRSAGHETIATEVSAIADDLRSFSQEKASRRTFRRFDLEGVVGSKTFADVPGCFLPWLTLAGILHVGGHRVAGAGGWSLHTGHAPPSGG